MFHVGQKVVCVDASLWMNYPWCKGTEVVQGTVYTVREVGVTTDGLAGVRLYEVVLSGQICAITYKPFRDRFYRASRFRPLTDTSQSTSFTTGAPRDSRKWDNRRKVKVRA